MSKNTKASYVDSNKLMALGFQSYAEYLQSDHWQNVRRRFFAESRRVLNMRRERGTIYCEFCRRSDVSLHLHHRSYRTLGRENLGHLILLCEDCHSACHARHRNYGPNLWAATKKVGRKRRRERPHQVFTGMNTTYSA